MPSVLVAMSGGVDSSVTACLLREQGYECLGATMYLHKQHEGEQESSCCGARDVVDAKSVCANIGIPHETFDMTDAFEEHVVGRFADAYDTGLTPNPCIDCNKHMKFGLLLDIARKMGCDFIATGHYARIERGGRRLTLAKAADPAKDQSYVLYALTQDQLAHTLFPLGGLTKPQVRAIAEAHGFVNAHKSESQDICFVPDGDYLAFLERRRGCPYQPGNIVTQDGTVVGRHRGAAGYTIGQRKGLGVALRDPMYVCAKDMGANTVTLGPAESLMARSCVVGEWNWIAEPAQTVPDVAAKTHYRQREQPCRVISLQGDRVRLEFDEAQRAMTPGQAAVVYRGNDVVGGGTILWAE